MDHSSYAQSQEEYPFRNVAQGSSFMSGNSESNRLDELLQARGSLDQYLEYLKPHICAYNNISEYKS